MEFALHGIHHGKKVPDDPDNYWPDCDHEERREDEEEDREDQFHAQLRGFLLGSLAGLNPQVARIRA